jgi:hypothetical protein
VIDENSKQGKKLKLSQPTLQIVCYSSAVKSGCRFVDEMSIFEQIPGGLLQLYLKPPEEDLAVVK